MRKLEFIKLGYPAQNVCSFKRNEEKLRDLWDNVKRPKIQITGVPEEEERKAMRKYWRR